MFNFNLFSGLPNFRPFQGKINCWFEKLHSSRNRCEGRSIKRGEGSGDVNLSFRGFEKSWVLERCFLTFRQGSAGFFEELVMTCLFLSNAGRFN